jgi:hypothetical protein
MSDTITFKQFEPEPLDGPCTITFTWAESVLGGRQTVTVDLLNGDYPAIVEQVRSSGGIYVDSGRETIAFYPWPPTHIEIDPA